MGNSSSLTLSSGSEEGPLTSQRLEALWAERIGARQFVAREEALGERRGARMAMTALFMALFFPTGFLAHLAQLTGTQFSSEKATRWLEATAAGDLVAHDDLEVGCFPRQCAQRSSHATFFFFFSPVESLLSDARRRQRGGAGH